MSQQKVESPLFQQGLKDGLPICLGYISVAFTFGMMATEGGLAPWSSLLISMTNLTSAGQFAGTALILSGGTLLEIAVTTFVINIRYMLMSLSLSQKLDPDMKMAERLILSFGVTDEVFAVAIRQRKELTARYLAGLILTPYAGWALGTVLGATATGVLPLSVRSALGIAIYGMFIAIIIPPSREAKPVAITVVLAATAVMALVTYLPRMLPMAVIKRKIQNRFIRSFLTYVPYAVLSAMTFPAILYSTSDNLAVGVPSAAAGLLVALVLAYHNRGLLTVALASSAAVFIVQQALLWLGW